MTNTETSREMRHLAWAVAVLFGCRMPPETTAVEVAAQIGIRRMAATGTIDSLLGALLHLRDGMDRAGVDDVPGLLAWLERRGFRPGSDFSDRGHLDWVLVSRDGEWVRDAWPDDIHDFG